jgi:phosphomannomutase
MRPVLHDYEDHLAERFADLAFPSFTVVVDCSNGVGGLALRALERLGIAHAVLYHVPDGNFPNHGCDTLRPENLQRLSEEVRARRAGLGIMFDGDADRVAFVDERGEAAPLDLVFVLLAGRELARRKGRVFLDLRFSRAVEEEIVKLGGIPVRMRVGNPFYKEALHRHEDGILAAELSGHLMYREHFGIDDPLFASLKLLACLGDSGDSLSRRLQPLRRYAGSGELRLEAPDPGALVATAAAHFPDGVSSAVDGISIQYPDWWFNLRPSNTEPVAKLVIEADTPALLERRKRELLELLGASGGRPAR